MGGLGHSRLGSKRRANLIYISRQQTSSLWRRVTPSGHLISLFPHHLPGDTCLHFFHLGAQNLLRQYHVLRPLPNLLFSLKTPVSSGPLSLETCSSGPSILLLWERIHANKLFGGYGFNTLFKKWISKWKHLWETNLTWIENSVLFS